MQGGRDEWTPPEVVLITAAQMPKPDPETHLLLKRLVELHVRAVVLPWNANVPSWKEVSLVVLRTPWDYFHQPDEFLNWAAEVGKQTRLVNPFEVLKWNIHKGYMLDLEHRGVPIVPTQLIRASDVHTGVAPLVDLTSLGFEGDTIVKPAFSIGAIGLQRGEANSLELGAHAHELLASGQDVLVQAFVPSVQEKGEVSLVFFDGQFSYSIRKVPKEGDFRVQDHHGGTVVAHVATEREVVVAKMALEAAPRKTTYARVDLVESGDGGPIVMELELIEPELFLRYSEEGLRTFADHIVQLLKDNAEAT